MSRLSARIGRRSSRTATGGVRLTSSTPDALWNAPAARLLRPAAVTCTDLTRGTLLNRCSLSVPVGRRLLVVSEPDASASMLLRILSGLSRPSRGRVELAGMSDPSTTGWGHRVAYLGPEPSIHGWMTPRETLELAAELLDLPAAEAERRTRRAIAWARIPAEALGVPVRRGGPPITQRTGLASALLADPEVLLLDEPLRALDAHERARLLRLPGRRRTIVMATRYPASETGIATHVAFLRDGRVAFEEPIADLAPDGAPLTHAALSARAASPGPAPEGAVTTNREAVSR